MSSIENKANLEMTLEDHIEVGSSAPRILRNNPGRTMAELMSDEEIDQFMVSALEKLEKVSKENSENHNSGNAGQIELLKLLRDEFILPNIGYLETIGRLPVFLKGRTIDLEYPV